MSKKISEENVSVALRFIVDNFGKNTLQDSNRVNAILNDLVPKLSKESKWVKEAIELGIVKILLDERNIDDSNRKLSLNRAELMMKEDHISQERINFILDSFLYGLGWTNKKANNPEITNPNVNPKTNNDDDIETTNPNVNPKTNNDDDNIETINPDAKGTKHKFIIPLVILIIIGGLCYNGFNNIGTEDVYAKEVTFDVNYKKEGSKYVFDNGDFILMDVSLGGSKNDKIDESKLSYEVDDNSICTISNQFNKCRIMGIREGTTIIHIYYGDKEIKSINLEFKGIDANDISIKEISFSADYTVKGGTYIFDLNNPIYVNVDLENNLESKVDMSKLSFEVGDSNICDISNAEGSCTITGINEGKTFLRILYDNKNIKFIPISFEDSTIETPDNDASGPDNGTLDPENKTSDYDEFESNGEVDLTVKHYWENYANAINSGDVSYLSDYLTSDGDFYNELVKSVPDRYEKGITLEVLSYKKEKMTSEENYYRVGCTIEYHIYKPEGEVYQKEYMEFILVPSGSNWLIDRYENWKLLEQREY